MYLRLSFLLLFLSFLSPRVCAVADVPEDDSLLLCPLTPVGVTRLPDLSIPRSGHYTAVVGGELLVAGGHTSGFVPTDTAEYFDGSEWHKIPTVYSHDFGLFIKLRSGDVLLGGGCSQELGIGQTFSVERYHPKEHRFEGFGCMDSKRCYAEAVELDSGEVVISGNWYRDDAIERFDGRKLFSLVSAASQNRARPYVFRVSRDDVMIFSGTDSKGNLLDEIVIDRLHGKPFNPELFDQWRPLPTLLCHPAEDCFIGDESKGEYRYLFPVVRGNAEIHTDQVAIAVTDSTSFSILPTVCPVPTSCEYGLIRWFTAMVADRQSGNAYLPGRGEDGRIYVLRVGYHDASEKSPASMTLFYTEPLPDVAQTTPVLTPDGNILLAGGVEEDNFAPMSGVYVLHVATPADCVLCSAMENENGGGWWVPMLIAIATVCLAAVVFLTMRKRKVWGTVPKSLVESREEPENEQEVPPVSDSDDDLMEQVCRLMEEQRLYLRSRLRVSDVASLLGTNSSYVTDCINSKRGCSFSHFVNEYRVEHAKRLMMESPDMKVMTVCTESGFSNETSFFRTFKQIAGKTPREWLLAMGQADGDNA